MDEVDAPRRQRRPRDSFQNELRSKLSERKSRGLAADVTSEESEEDSLHNNEDMYSQYAATRQNRPGSAKRRPDHAGAATWNPSLENTLRAQDMNKLLGRKTPTNLDGYDPEVDQALNKRKGSHSFEQQGLRTTPPTKEGLFGRKTPTKDDGLQKGGGLFGRKTPTRESPGAQELSKEEIIFGRKTPTGKSPTGDLPTLGGTWQPPNFRNISPSADQRGLASSPANSQGRRTPGLESGLESISENKTPRDKPPRYGRLERGRDAKSPGLSDESPRSDRPTPRARHKPAAEVDTDKLKRTTPTLDLFGKSRRESSFELEKELKEIDDKKEKEEERQRRIYGRHTPTGRKTPTDRQTPTGRKSPGPARQARHKSPVDARGRKTPTNHRGGFDEEDKQQKKDADTPSLLDFLTGDVKQEKPQPKPKERPRRNRIPKEETPDLFGASRVNGEPLPQPHVKVADITDKEKKPSDSSSVCEEVKEDPDAPFWREDDGSKDTKKQGLKRIDTEIADDAIRRIGEEQKKPQDLKTTKKVRPVTAEAKVIHRPKPRYGTLPGQAQTPTELTDFNSTTDIREAVYTEWYRQRIKKAREEQKRKEQKEKEEEEKKRKEQEEKETEAKMSFQAWQEKKKELLAKEKARKLREEEKKREKEEEERENKRVEAELSFKSWKEKKDVKLKDQHHQKKMTEKEKKEKEREEKALKEKDSETAFRGWKAKKDQVIKHRVVEERHKKKRQETEEEALKRQKEEEAEERYRKWMEEKEKQEQRQKLEMRRRKMSGDLYDFRPAWSPANHTVPFGR